MCYKRQLLDNGDCGLTIKRKTREDILRLIHEENVRYIRLWFADILGQLKGMSITVSSQPSGPLMASSTNAQSSTARQIGPILSIDHDSAIAPYRLT